MTMPKQTRVRFVIYGIAYGVGVLTILVLAATMIPAAVVTALYSYTADDYIYTQAAKCTVVNTFILNGTCNYEYCVSDGPKADERCKMVYYECYYGVWNMTSGDCVAQLFTEKYNNLPQAATALRSHNGTQTCYHRKDTCDYRWSKDDSPDALFAAMIALWVLFGVCLPIACCAMLTACICAPNIHDDFESASTPKNLTETAAAKAANVINAL